MINELIYCYRGKKVGSGFSSAGRAFDCRGHIEIKGSLVQIREAGLFGVVKK